MLERPDAQTPSSWSEEVGRRAPNILTLCRFLAVPVFVLLMIDPSPAESLWAAGIFIFASLTDWLDGYLARLYRAESILGTLLDPLADKVLVMAALVMLVADRRVPAWMVVVLLSREMIVTGLRSLAAIKGVVVPASQPAKHKTAWTMIAVVFLLIDRPMAIFGTVVNFHVVGLWFLSFALALALYSGFRYGVALRNLFE